MGCAGVYLVLRAVGKAKTQSAQQFVTSIPSILIIVAAVAMLVVTLKVLRPLAAQWKSVGLKNVMLAFAGILIPSLIVRSISDPNMPNANSAGNVLKWAFFPLDSEGKFLIAFLTLSLVWGPLLMLLGLRWRNVAAKLRQLGPGAVGLVAFTLPLALPIEPRFILGAWPFVVLALVLALEELRPTRAFAIAFATLTVLLAQFWMPLNVGPWTGTDHEGLLSFPKQMVFMHYGPWINWTMYWSQSIAIVLGGFWLHSTLKAGSRQAENAGEQGPAVPTPSFLKRRDPSTTEREDLRR